MSEIEKPSGRRAAILSAAEKVFHAKGYAAATMEAVAVEAGVAKGSIYNYFKNKHDLFSQLYAQVVSGSITDVDGITKPASSAREKLQAVLDYWSGRFDEYKPFCRLVLEFWATAAHEADQGELMGMFRRFYGDSRRLVSGIIVEGVESGEFTSRIDASVAASLILAMLDGILVQAALDVGITVDADFIAALKGSIITALTAGTNQRDQSEG